MKRIRINGEVVTANQKVLLDWVFSISSAIIFLTSFIGIGYIVDSFEITRLWKIVIWGVLSTVLVVCTMFMTYLFDTSVNRHSR